MPLSKTVHDAISGKEGVSNKVTSITPASNDSQYPSAKAVYGELSSLQKDIDTIGTSDKWVASPPYISATDLIYAAIPPWVATLQVTSTFSDVAATMGPRWPRPKARRSQTYRPTRPCRPTSAPTSGKRSSSRQLHGRFGYSVRVWDEV